MLLSQKASHDVLTEKVEALHRHIKFFKDSELRLFLVGYESGNEEILRRIKKGVTLDEMRRFTKSCHQAGVVIHGTFILGLTLQAARTATPA